MSSRSNVPPRLAFRHPILRLALRDPRYTNDYAEFSRSVRRSLDEGLTPQDRRQFARLALESLARLNLPEEMVNDFVAEWLGRIHAEVNDPVVLHLLALARLREHSLYFDPPEWMSTSLALRQARGSLPSLRSSDKSLEKRVPMLPVDAASLWRAAIDVLRKDVVTGDVRHWDAYQCHAALKSLFILVCVGSDASAHRDVEEASVTFLDGEGAAMLQALQHRLGELDDLIEYDEWIDRMRMKLVLRLKGRSITANRRDQSVRAGTQSALGADGVTAGEGGAYCAAAGEAVIVTEPIPAATDRYDHELLNTYEVLRHPLPIAAMPAPQKLRALLETLRAEFPWAEQAIGRLEELLVPPSVLGAKTLSIRPLLFVGPPGSGKSRLCRRMAELLELAYLPVPCGGTSDVKVLSGTARGWASGAPTPILQTLLQQRCASAFVLLDEVDKARETTSSSPPLLNLLLGLLEKETAARYRDGFLQARCDLSHIVWAATANSLRPIPNALISRFEIVFVRAPGPEHLPALAQSVIREIEREWGLPANTLPPVPEEIWGGLKLTARQMRPVMQKLIYMWVKDVLDPKRLH